MEEAIQAYHSITVTPEFREIERLRSKARHDEAQAIWNAERRKTMTIARNMIKDGEPVDKIMRYTSLTREEIQSLRDTD